MNKRKIFKRKNSNKKLNILLVTLFILIISIIYIFYLQTQNKFFVVDENKEEFYIIPSDKKGKIIPYKDIKILDYDYNLEKNIEKNNINYNFSIQLYASSNYDSTLDKLNNFANNLSYLEEDLFIVVLKHNLGIDYLLVYKNFKSRKEAFDYCTQYLNFIRDCLIVNIQNLD